jgi:predicted permease
MRPLLARVVALFRRGRLEAELADEIHAHLEFATRDNIAKGLVPDEARLAALRKFDGPAQVREAYRDRLGFPILESMWRDLRYVGRSLRRSPVFTLTVVLTLALGIGANTAIFSVVNAVILKPYGYPGADRLVVIHEVVRRIPLAPRLPVNAVHFQEWRDTTTSFEQLALLREISVNLTGSGEPERLTAGRVSASLFPMLGVHAQLGRTLLEEEDRAGRDRVVVLTDELWRRRFGADPGIIGRPITLDDQPYVVVGVLPADFRFPRLSDLYAISITATQPQLWKPFGLRDEERSPIGDYNYACVAKLRPGVTPGHAASELEVVQARIEERFRETLGLGAVVLPLGQQVTSRARMGLWLLLAASGAVLLIACVNVASLLLGRATTRKREFAIRRAIGATAGRLIAQLMAECGVLGFMAAVLGVSLAQWTTRAIGTLAPIDLPRVNEIRLDLRVLLFALATSALTAILMGVMPAWRSTQSDFVEAASGAGRTSTPGRSTMKVRSLLVAAEIGLSAVCLVAAGLFLRSFAQLMTADKGFDAERLMLVDLSLSPRRYPDLDSTSAFVRAMLEQLSIQPGVISTGVVSQAPLAGAGGNNSLLAEGVVASPAETPIVDFRPVNPGYFRTMGIPFRRGRIFDEGDRARPVALVSEATAIRAWPGENPIGKRFRLGGTQAPHGGPRRGG